MKKLLALLLASILVVGSLAGCKRDNNKGEESSSSSSSQTEENDGTLKDGEYTATFDIAALDRTVDALKVTVTGGEMKITDYTALEPPVTGASSSEGSSSSAASSSAAESSSQADPATERATTEEIVREQLMNILDQYDDNGGDLDKIVPELHAEEHAYRFVRMMRALQDAAKKGDTSPIILGKYADGTYKSTMPEANEAGWTEYVEITVSGGLVTDVVFDAIKDGKKITEDDEANKAENKPSDYYPAIATAFREAAEDLTKVFSPQGGQLATSSFIKLTTPLLNNMISGGEKEIVAPKYLDGTYKAEFSDYDENGWKDYVVVKVVKGVPQLTEYNATHKDDAKKKRSADKELGEKMKSATGTYNYAEVQEQLILALEKSGSDVLKIENVAGATVSTNNMKLLVGEILATTASEGDTAETLVVERVASEKK